MQLAGYKIRKQQANHLHWMKRYTPVWACICWRWKTSKSSAFTVPKMHPLQPPHQPQPPQPPLLLSTPPCKCCHPLQSAPAPVQCSPATSVRVSQYPKTTTLVCECGYNDFWAHMYQMADGITSEPQAAKIISSTEGNVLKPAFGYPLQNNTFGMIRLLRGHHNLLECIWSRVQESRQNRHHHASTCLRIHFKNWGIIQCLVCSLALLYQYTIVLIKIVFAFIAWLSISTRLNLLV